MILILLLILNNSSVGHTRAELKSKPTAIRCQNHAILSVDYKLSIILGRRRPEQWRGWDGKVFTNKARWKYAYCIEGRQVEYKCGLLSQYLSMNFATWWCSTTLYNVLNDAFQALIAFIVPISFKNEWVWNGLDICKLWLAWKWYTHINTSTRTRQHAYTRAHTHPHARTHARTHTHTHTQSQCYTLMYI